MAYRMLWTQTYITHVDHNRSKSLITLVFMIAINPFSPLMINWYSCRKCLKYRFALYRFESMGDSKNEWKMTINYIIFNTCSTFEMIRCVNII